MDSLPLQERCEETSWDSGRFPEANMLPGRVAASSCPSICFPLLSKAAGRTPSCLWAFSTLTCVCTKALLLFHYFNFLFLLNILIRFPGLTLSGCWSLPVGSTVSGLCWLFFSFVKFLDVSLRLKANLCSPQIGPSEQEWGGIQS